MGRDGGGVDMVRHQEVPPCGVRRQEGHVRGEEAAVQGVHPGEDSSYGGDSTARQGVVMGQEVARVWGSWWIEG